MDYLTFRANALQNIALVKKPFNKKMTKDEIEKWIKKEYERHYLNK